MQTIIRCISTVVLLQVFSSPGYAEESNKPELMSLLEAVTTVQQAADYRLKYGPGVFHFGDLRLPKGRGPHPLVIIIHGGCWTAKYGLHLMDAMAERLTAMGYATWNPEFRRVGMRGARGSDLLGDVLMATEYVANLAGEFNLDTSKVILTGHSSGGHLVLWLAHHPQLNNEHTRLTIDTVVSLAPLTDLSTVARDESMPCYDTVAGLMDGPVNKYPERYRQASPVHMPGAGADIIVVNGKQDDAGFYRQFIDYRDAMKERGREIRHLEVAPSGHFEMITPGTRAWKDLEKVFRKLKK